MAKCNPSALLPLVYRVGTGAQKAFTLIQTMIAILILGVGLIPAMNLFYESNKVVYKSEAILDATLTGQAIIDAIKSEANLDRLLDKPFALPNSEYKEFPIPEKFHQKFKGGAEVRVTTAKNHHVPGRMDIEDRLRQIEVTVRWEEAGKKHDTTLLTFHADINSWRLGAYSRFK